MPSRSLSLDSSSSDDSRSRSSSIDSSSDDENYRQTKPVSRNDPFFYNDTEDEDDLLIDLKLEVNDGKYSSKITNLPYNIYTHVKFQEALARFKSQSLRSNIVYGNKCVSTFKFTYRLNETTLSLKDERLTQKKEYIVNDLNLLFGLKSDDTTSGIIIKRANGRSSKKLQLFPEPIEGDNMFYITHNLGNDEHIRLISSLKTAMSKMDKMRKTGIDALITENENEVSNPAKCVIKSITINGDCAFGPNYGENIETIFDQLKVEFPVLNQQPLGKLVLTRSPERVNDKKDAIHKGATRGPKGKRK
jgi:hypothetical protein